MRTKWEILQDLREEATRKLARLEAEIKWLEETPFTANGTGSCSGCDQVLPTEADFAKHYVVPDERYYNLGYCPSRG